MTDLGRALVAGARFDAAVRELVADVVEARGHTRTDPGCVEHDGSTPPASRGITCRVCTDLADRAAVDLAAGAAMPCDPLCPFVACDQCAFAGGA